MASAPPLVAAAGRRRRHQNSSKKVGKGQFPCLGLFNKRQFPSRKINFLIKDLQANESEKSLGADPAVPVAAEAPSEAPAEPKRFARPARDAARRKAGFG